MDIDHRLLPTLPFRSTVRFSFYCKFLILKTTETPHSRQPNTSSYLSIDSPQTVTFPLAPTSASAIIFKLLYCQTIWNPCNGPKRCRSMSFLFAWRIVHRSGEIEQSAGFLLAKVNNANERPARILNLLSMEYNCLQVEPFFRCQCWRIMKIFNSFPFVSRVLLISLQDYRLDWSRPKRLSRTVLRIYFSRRLYSIWYIYIKIANTYVDIRSFTKYGSSRSCL